MPKDKFLTSAGYGCDMTFFNETADGEAFIHHVNGQWLFDKKVYWSWLQPLANAGIPLHRIFLYCVGGKRKRSECFFPWQYVPASDAFDFRVKNQPFFDILRQQVVEANKMKVQVMVCVLNECEERKADRKEQSPFYHNINGVDGLYDRKVLPSIGELTHWICDALQGLDYSVELINEGHRKHSGSGDAVNMMLPILLEHGVEPWRISLGADIVDSTLTGFRDVSDWQQRWPNESPLDDKDNYDIFYDRLHLVKYYNDSNYNNATHEVFYLICHNFADRTDAEFPEIFPYGRRTGYAIEAGVKRNLCNNRVCFSTDGTDFADAPSGRPSPERMKAAMLHVMRSNPRYKESPLVDGRPKLWFDFLPGGESTPNIIKVVDAMNEAHREFFGVDLENRGNVPTYDETYPDVVPEPEPEPEPEPPTTTCGKKRWYQHLPPWGNPTWNFKAAWEHLRGLHDTKIE